MNGEIKIQKNLLVWFAVLIIAIIASGYVVFTAIPKTQTSGPDVLVKPGFQEVYIKALSTGTYDKETVTVKKGVPVKLYFSADRDAGCGRAMILDGFNIQLVSRNGETQMAEFTPNREGTYSYHCSMRMFVGRLIVVP